ncbi:MAG: ComEA family DNA-binding protein [FCB group bacterium]|nr:ComEA family DNA-binding protein [FCB group bacterium]
MGIILRIGKEKIFTDSSENLKLVAVSEEINSIYNSESATLDTAEAVQRSINVNSADVVALSELPGIGPALAGRIIVDREQNGKYNIPEDLRRVRGIGMKVLEKILPYIAF